jgi:hypothetical protein
VDPQSVFGSYVLPTTSGANDDVSFEHIDERVVSALEIEGDLRPQLDIEKREWFYGHER